jgi:hypothetical protein
VPALFDVRDTANSHGNRQADGMCCSHCQKSRRVILPAC